MQRDIPFGFLPVQAVGVVEYDTSKLFNLDTQKILISSLQLAIGRYLSDSKRSTQTGSASLAT